jgi:DNA polymerase-3 subunit delta'
MSFQNIKGQDKPLSLLKAYLAHSRLEGSFLFSGPEGVGKRMAAITLAKAVNCLEDGLDACSQCPSCKKIEQHQHPDVHIISAGEGEIKIELIRQMQQEIFLRPYEGKKKVFIFDNAHRLNPEAANALLKVLEEPPPASLIILLSDKPTLLFRTIISRCKTVKFFPLKRQQLKEILEEDYKLTSQLAHFLAYFSEGRLGYALRLKDSEIFQEKNRLIDTFTMPRQPRLDLAAVDKETLRRWLNILASWFRDIYLLKAGLAPSEAINFDRRQDLLHQMDRFPPSELNRILNFIPEAISHLEHNINLRLLLHNLGAELWKG